MDDVGRRVRLIYTSDQYTRLTPGTEGTVTLVDALGTVHVKWDDGSRLGMVEGEDRFEFITDKEHKLIHLVHNIDDKELRMRVGIGPIVGGVQAEVYLTVWTQYPPCNSPDDAKPTTHVKISDPL